MPEYSVEITDVEDKAIRAHIKDPQEWVENALRNKARKCIDRLFETVDDRRAKKVDTATKEMVIEKLVIEEYSEERQGKDLKNRITRNP